MRDSVRQFFYRVVFEINSNITMLKKKKKVALSVFTCWCLASEMLLSCCELDSLKYHKEKTCF